MKGIRFYEEFTNTSKHTSEGNVVALLFGLGYQGGTLNMDAVVGVYEWPNSAVATSSTNADYLHSKCKRIPESKARQIHPRLFSYLEGNN